MRTSTDSQYKKIPTPNYSPAVPLSVYRELAGELQAVQAKLDITTTHNQKIIQENQELRQEITKVIKAFAYLQKLVDSSVLPGAQPNPGHPTSGANTPQYMDTGFRSPQTNSHPGQPTVVPTPIHKQQYTVEMNHPRSEPILIEEEEVRYYATTDSDLNGLNGWWLVLAIALIIVTGFSAGYFFVHPLFQQQKP